MESQHRIHGTLAAAVTPLTAADGSIDGDGIAAVVDFYARAGLDGVLALGTTGEGILFSVDERRRRGRRVRDLSASPTRGRGALRGADHARHGGSRRACGEPRRGRSRGDPASVLRTRRGGHLAPPRRGRTRMRTTALLHLRVRSAERLRGPGRGGPATAVHRAEPRRAQGLRLSVRSGQAVPDSRPRRVHRRRRPDLSGTGVRRGRRGLRPCRGAPGADHRRRPLGHTGGERSRRAGAIQPSNRSRFTLR